MKKHFTSFALLMAAIGIFALGGAAAAQYQPQYRGDSDRGGYVDPPYRVARVGYAMGDVAFQPYDYDDWIQIEENRPLVEGDRLWVDRGSRSEMHIGSTAVRLDEGSGLAIAQLTDSNVRLRLVQGTMNVNVIRIHDGERYTIEAGDVDVVLLRPGIYRFDVSPVGDRTTIKVREGVVNAVAGSQTTTVREGRQVTYEFRGGAVRRFMESLGRPDRFDHWCIERNEREDRSRSASYVTRELVGYHDLDQYGDWLNDPDYGYVWYPRAVGTDWAPYRNGRWEWIEPWGWTWIGAERWGFAPYHYGRWAHRSGRWCWVPGPKTIRPVYGPGFVRFVGSRERNVPYVFGREAVVGWVPMGPRDIYMPSYRASTVYVQHLNIRNGRWGDAEWNRRWEEYRRGGRDRWRSAHWDTPGAGTFVRRETFVSSRPVRSGRVELARERFERADDEDRTELRDGRSSWRDRGGVERSREEGSARSSVRPPQGIDARLRARGPAKEPARVQTPPSWGRNETSRQEESRGGQDEAARIRERAEQQRQADETRMRDESFQRGRQDQQRQETEQRQTEQRRQEETRAREEDIRRRENETRARDEQARQEENRSRNTRPLQMMDQRRPNADANRAFDRDETEQNQNRGTRAVPRPAPAAAETPPQAGNRNANEAARQAFQRDDKRAPQISREAQARNEASLRERAEQARTNARSNNETQQQAARARENAAAQQSRDETRARETAAAREAAAARNAEREAQRKNETKSEGKSEGRNARESEAKGARKGRGE